MKIRLKRTSLCVNEGVFVGAVVHVGVGHFGIGHVGVGHVGVTHVGVGHFGIRRVKEVHGEVKSKNVISPLSPPNSLKRTRG